MCLYIKYNINDILHNSKYIYIYIYIFKYYEIYIYIHCLFETIKQLFFKYFEFCTLYLFSVSISFHLTLNLYYI